MSDFPTVIPTTHGEVVRVMLMGAGSSSSTPKMGCLASKHPCKVCAEAHANPSSKNHRLNPSLLIQVRSPSTTTVSGEANAAAIGGEDNASAPKESASSCASPPLTLTAPINQSVPYNLHVRSKGLVVPNHDEVRDEYLNILIDCGKTFRESSMRHFPTLGVHNLHAVLITHDHADACFGVDDLREFTGTSQDTRTPMPVYLDARTDDTMRRVFGYLYPKLPQVRSDNRWIASLTWNVFEQGKVIPVRMSGPPTKAMREAYKTVPHDERPAKGDKKLFNDLTFPVTSVPIEHGPGYYSNGFVFELMPGRVCVYYSDISRFDDEDEAQLRAVVGDRVIEVLVLDLLSTTPYFSHFSREQSVACAVRIGAQHTYFVGMSHTINYNDANESIMAELAKHGLSGELAYDGCVLFDALKV